MGQDPDAIRREIEQTRERMGETVEALGYKADVPSRTKEAVSDKVSGVTSGVTDKVQSVKESIVGAKDSAVDALPGGGGGGGGGSATGGLSDKKDQVLGTISERTPSTGEVKAKARRGAAVAQQNPLGLAVGSLALGFLAGMLIPETRKEHETLGPVADQVKEQVRSTGQEALERGRTIAQEVASTAQEHGQQIVQEVKETTQQAAQDVKETAQQSAQEQGSELKQSAQQNAQQGAESARSQVRS